ncbi:hypothetical protein IAT40_004280 [Kwoniella sp. CBS 6097]
MDHALFQRLLPVHHIILDLLALVDPYPCLLASKFYHRRYLPPTYQTLTYTDSVLWGLTTESHSPDRTLQALSHVHTLRFDHDPQALVHATRGTIPYTRAWKELFPNVRVLYFSAGAILQEMDALLDRETLYLPVQNTLWFHVRRPLQRVLIDLRGDVGEEMWKTRRSEVERVVHRFNQELFADDEGQCEYLGVAAPTASTA